MSERHVLVPHQCIYNHTWQVRLPYGCYYNDPGARFCKVCLERNIIEIASIQLVTTYDAVLEYSCPWCERRTLIPLPPDICGVTLLGEGEMVEDWFTPKPRWYHLPKRWPIVCEHFLDDDKTYLLPRRKKEQHS